MEESWQKDIRDRMENFEVDEPQGLWEAICSAESAAAAAPQSTKSHGRSRLLWLWGIAAAACMLLFATIHPLLYGPAPETAGIAQHRAQPDSKVLTGKGAAGPKPMRRAAGEDLLALQNMRPKGLGRATDMPEAALCSRAAEDRAQLEAERAQTDADPAIGSADAEPVRFGTYDDLVQHIEPEEIAPKRHGRRFELALTGGAGNGAKIRQIYSGGAPAGSSDLGAAEWNDSPLLGIMTTNKGAETERRVTFHMPIRTGLSLRYELSDRWSVETGLSYAFVSSRTTEGTAVNYVEEKQKLHYLGVPLGVSCRLVSWRNLDVYVSGNVLAEKCVDAESDRRFYIAGKQQGEDVSRISFRPLQWSVGAKAGLQYNFTDMFSVYAEPGCTYYFDDRSPLETVFKKRPFDFSLHFGVRCSLGKKKV